MIGNHQQKLRSMLAVMTVSLVSWHAAALQSLDDDAMAGVAGQSGVTFTLIDNAINGGNLNLTTDTGGANQATNQFQNFSFASIGQQGASPTGSFYFTQNMDVGSRSTTAPGMEMSGSWSRIRVSSSQMALLNAAGANSTGGGYGFGSAALDASGTMLIANSNGLLSSTALDTSRQGAITLGSPQLGLASPLNNYSQLYFRIGAAGSPEVIFDKMYLQAGLANGAGGVFAACLPGSCDPLGLGTRAFGATQNGGLYIGTTGTAGQTNLGYNFNWVIKYRGAPTGSFTTANNDSSTFMYYGWAGSNYSGTCPGATCTFTGFNNGGAYAPTTNSGGFSTAELLLSGGGLWTPTAGMTQAQADDPSGRNQGVHIRFHGDFDNYFSWLVGQPGFGLVDFSRWNKMPGADWALSAPNITYDVVNSGQVYGGGLCWGAQYWGSGTAGSGCGSTTWVNGRFTRGGMYLDLPPQNTALALNVRDLSLQSYSQAVTILDALGQASDFGTFTNNTHTVGSGAGSIANYPESITKQWALIYTYGQLDFNTFFYPGNAIASGSSTSNGVNADVVFMLQSFNNNAAGNAHNACSGADCILTNNTNLMIADTGLSTPLGFGIVQANMLFAAKGLNFTFNPISAGTTGVTSSGIGLKTNEMRFELEGMVAGGPVPNLNSSNIEKLFYGDLNLESPLTVANIFPATYTHSFLVDGTSTNVTIPYIGYNAFLRLADTSASGNKIGICGDTVYTTNSCTTHGNFLSLQEPSQVQAGASIDIDNVTGDICLGSICSATTPNGLATGVYLFSAADAVQSPDHHARLTFANTMQIGSTIGGGANCGGVAAAGTCQPLIGEVRLSNAYLGSVAIPSGQIYSSVSLRP